MFEGLRPQLCDCDSLLLNKWLVCYFDLFMATSKVGPKTIFFKKKTCQLSQFYQETPGSCPDLLSSRFHILISPFLSTLVFKSIGNISEVAQTV